MADRAPVVVAVDAGTTGVRSLAVDARATVVDLAYRPLTQHFPHPGWVEHDAEEIWAAVVTTLGELVGRLAGAERAVVALGITNQRETVVAWDRRDGAPLAPAIVWQDRRTAAACDALAGAGHLPLVRARTGLVLDPYFSATKMHWLLTEGGVPTREGVTLGTVDSWVLWRLTGGPAGGVLATDTTNASRTLLFDITAGRWSEELCELFGVPMSLLPAVAPSCGRFGTLSAEVVGPALAGVPVSGVAGDQHAALFGQACFAPGMAKATYGTGSFVLLNAGATCPAPVDGLLTTVAWDLGAAGAPPSPGEAGREHRGVAYALEGSAFASGAAVQWLRDGLGTIDRSEELEPLARTVDSSEGVVLVPAFTGLGSPYWDPSARGTVLGLSRGPGRAHLARATIEAMAYQVRDVLDAMARAGVPAPSVVRADGGAAVMDLLLQVQADQTRLPVTRPRSVETTAVGAATLAGLAEGVWSSVDELARLWQEEATFRPVADVADAERGHRAWLAAVERTREWAGP